MEGYREPLPYPKAVATLWTCRPISDIAYSPGYGVIAHSLVTTNGDAEAVRRLLCPDECVEFERWLHDVGYYDGRDGEVRKQRRDAVITQAKEY